LGNDIPVSAFLKNVSWRAIHHRGKSAAATAPTPVRENLCYRMLPVINSEPLARL
jgi:hypothetical protein